MATNSGIESLFNCPICFEILKSPKYLPCLHTFCEECIQSHIETSLQARPSRTSIKCPICRRRMKKPSQDFSPRKWTNSLPKNHQLLAFQDICDNILRPKILCDSCTKNKKKSFANVRCTECNDNLCENCNKLIHRVKELALHTIVDSLGNQSEETQSDFETCVVHAGNRIEVYCFDHDQLGCRFCLTNEHKDCKAVLALVIGEKIKKELETPTASNRQMEYYREVSVAQMETQQRVLRGISFDFTASICKKILVGVLDIRNVFGFAFSLMDNWSTVMMTNFTTLNGNRSMNMPASLLFNQDKSLRDIGYMAQTRYFEEKDDGNANDFYYFHQVSTIFEPTKVITKTTEFEDDTGKKMKAEEIYDPLIKRLIEELLQMFRMLGSVTTADIRLVLMLPTQSNEGIIQVLLNAANKCGISSSSLLTVLQAEAAFFYYQYMVPQKRTGNEVCVGKKYTVVCLEENRTVLSIVKKQEDGSSIEILKIISEPWSMLDLVNEFECFLIEILGEELIQKVKNESGICYGELIENFKVKFYSAKYGEKCKIAIPLPLSIIESVKDEKNTDFKRVIDSSTYAKKIKIHLNKMYWESNDFFDKFGKKPADRIIRLIKSVRSGDLADVDTLLLAGDLSECDYVKQAVQTYFVQKRVVCLSCVDVLKGAVYIGHMID